VPNWPSETKLNRSSDLASALMAVLDDAALDRLADLLAPRLAARTSAATIPSDRWLTSSEAAAHLGLTLHALHKLTAAQAIPFEQDRAGCKLWFQRSKLDRWRQGGGSRSHARCAG
jgi:hypothetical protein